MSAEAFVDCRDRYCIVGAGASGLTVAKNFAAAGIPIDCLERRDGVGGNWYFDEHGPSVHRSTHLISSKRLTEYRDFPMPADLPAYPGQQQVCDYFRDYARHFGLARHIEFGCHVTRIEPHDDAAAWDVTLTTTNSPEPTTRRYRGVVIANGHHAEPIVPEYPGTFAGQVLHSSAYKSPEVLTGKRVLVVGAGNSGCDLAVESAQYATATWHSTRRGYHYLPKFLRGKPIDECGEMLLRWRLPLWLRRWITSQYVKVILGPPERYGLRRPDHRLLETHPIINSQMLYFVGHGRIRPKPDVAELLPHAVRFVDGTSEPIDVIVYATGFRISFPFIDTAHLNWQAGRPNLYLGAFHPRYDNLFVAGLIQPDGGLWGLVDDQAQLMARFVKSQTDDPRRAERFRRRKAQPAIDLSGGIHYVASPRHLLEVEHFGYRQRLAKLIAELA